MSIGKTVILLFIIFSSSIYAKTTNPLCVGKLYEETKKIYMSPASSQFNKDQVQMVNRTIDEQIKSFEDFCKSSYMDAPDLIKKMFSECSTLGLRPDRSLDNDLLYRCANNSERVTSLYDGYNIGRLQIESKKECENKNSISNLKRAAKDISDIAKPKEFSDSASSAVPK